MSDDVEVSEETREAWNRLIAEGIPVPSVRQVYERLGHRGSYSRVAAECCVLQEALPAVVPASGEPPVAPADPALTQATTAAQSLAEVLEPLKVVLTPFQALCNAVDMLQAALQAQQLEVVRLLETKASLEADIEVLRQEKARYEAKPNIDSAGELPQAPSGSHPGTHPGTLG